MNQRIAIRRACTVADYQACQRVQRAAWGITDDGYVVPVATMVGAQLHGGLVLGAFLPDGEAVGMSFAFLGRVMNRLCLYSQLTGVVPGYQDQGIGYRLKHAQRDVAWAESVPCIAWAFDPLQAGNARFNLEKLGATAVGFIGNMYGSRTDALNLDTSTDRLIVVWETGPSAPRAPVGDVMALPRLVSWTADESEPSCEDPPAEAVAVTIEVPADINRLRRERPDRAEQWSVAVRVAFQVAFAFGFLAVGFVREKGPDGPRCFYVLDRSSAAPNGLSAHRA